MMLFICVTNFLIFIDFGLKVFRMLSNDILTTSKLGGFKLCKGQIYKKIIIKKLTAFGVKLLITPLLEKRGVMPLKIQKIYFYPFFL